MRSIVAAGTPVRRPARSRWSGQGCLDPYWRAEVVVLPAVRFK
jgi:hypothetical protein